MISPVYDRSAKKNELGWTTNGRIQVVLLSYNAVFSIANTLQQRGTIKIMSEAMELTAGHCTLEVSNVNLEK